MIIKVLTAYIAFLLSKLVEYARLELSRLITFREKLQPRPKRRYLPRLAAVKDPFITLA